MKKESAFTLIELLAVIIILGILLLAIPSITNYISSSRKKTYVATASKYVEAAINKINSLEFPFTDSNKTYYIPAGCLELERGGKSPYGNGEWAEAYVVVESLGDRFNYYWTSFDKTNVGVLLTSINDLTYEDVVPSVKKLDKGVVGVTTVIAIMDDNTCNPNMLIEELPPEVVEFGSVPIEILSTAPFLEVRIVVNGNNGNGVIVLKPEYIADGKAQFKVDVKIGKGKTNPTITSVSDVTWDDPYYRFNTKINNCDYLYFIHTYGDKTYTITYVVESARSISFLDMTWVNN